MSSPYRESALPSISPSPRRWRTHWMALAAVAGLVGGVSIEKKTPLVVHVKDETPTKDECRDSIETWHSGGCSSVHTCPHPDHIMKAGSWEIVCTCPRPQMSGPPVESK